MMTPCLAVAAKKPERGIVKTRIAAELGDDAAVELCRCALHDTLALAASISDVVHVLAYSPPTEDARRYFERAAPIFTVLPQHGSDLGARMANLFEHLTQRFGPVVLIGSDSPDMPAALIERAFDLLRTDADVVLGPAMDGGYYLIGLNSACPSLFEDIDWSTEAVAQQTRVRVGEASLRLSELPRWHDLDTVADLPMLIAPGAPLTRSFVAALAMKEER